MRETLATQRAHPVWGAYVTALLDDGNMTMPRRGVDAGDHPPITPMQASTEERVGGGGRGACTPSSPDVSSRACRRIVRTRRRRPR